MTIYYVDPVNGNNANNGLSWGAAKQFYNGFTLAAGDEVRYAKTPDPVSIGNVTWTAGTSYPGYMTAASSVATLVDDCESGWVSSGSPTVTHVATSKRVGTNSVNIVIGAGTSGKLAYKTLPSTMDLSGSSRISFWVRFSIANNATGGSIFQIKLCSDSAGATAVNTITLPSWYFLVGWVPVTIDTGSAFGSGINSIALYSSSATPAVTINIDNITVTGTGASSLALTDLIAKNDGLGRYFDIMGLDGTKIYIGSVINTALTFSVASPSNCQYYWDPAGTQTVDTVKRSVQPTQTLVQISSQSLAVQVALPIVSNTNATTIYFRGGYNTNTNTVDGETWWDGSTSSGYPFSFSLGGTFYRIENFGFVRYYSSFSNAANAAVSFNNVSQVNCANSIAFNYQITSASCFPTTDVVNSTSTIKWILYPNGVAAGTNTNLSFDPVSSDFSQLPTFNFTNTYSFGTGALCFTGQNVKINVGTVIAGSNSASIAPISIGTTGVTNDGKFYMTVNNAYTYTGGVVGAMCPIVVQSGSSYRYYPLTIDITGVIGAINAAAFNFPTTQRQGYTMFRFGASSSVTGTFTSSSNWCSTGNITSFNIGACSYTIYKDMPLPSAGFFGPGNSGNGQNISYVFDNYNKTAGDKRIYRHETSSSSANDTKWFLQSTVTQSGTGKAWSLQTGAQFSTFNRCTLTLPIVPVKSGVSVTASVWVRRSDANVALNFYTTPNEILSTNASAISSGSINTWEQLTLTFTPTDNGHVAFYVDAYKPTATNPAASFQVYVDAFSIA